MNDTEVIVYEATLKETEFFTPGYGMKAGAACGLAVGVNTPQQAAEIFMN